MPATAIYDSDCALCSRVKSLVESLDWFGTMRWIPLQSPEAAAFGIPRESLERAVYLVTGSGTTEGWRAVKRMAIRLPLAYILAACAIRKSPWSALVLAALFSPWLEPAGSRAYDWVARNRYRLPGSTCEAPIWDNRSK